jgi:hypothetical protein
MTTLRGRMFDFPGRERRAFSSANIAHDRGLSAIAEVLAAAAPLFRPLAADLTLTSFDAATHAVAAIADRQWFIVDERAFGGTSSGWQDPEVRRVASLDGRSLVDSAAAALDVPAAPGAVRTWTRLAITAVDAALPAAVCSPELDKLALWSGVGEVEVDVLHTDGGCRVGLAVDTDNPSPFGLELSRELDVLAMSLFVNWSLWWEPDAPGADDLAALIDRWTALGWRF